MFSAPKLCIGSYFISTTTLEEVFLKLEKEEDNSNNESRELEENAGLRNNALRQLAKLIEVKVAKIYMLQQHQQQFLNKLAQVMGNVVYRYGCI